MFHLQGGVTLYDLENMLPWERESYILLISVEAARQKEEMKKQQQGIEQSTPSRM